MGTLGLNHYLILSGILFLIGVGGFLTRRNLVATLMCIELMLNAGNLLLVAYDRFHAHGQAGQVMALFSFVIAACEAAVGLAIAVSVFRLLGTIRTDEVKEMKG